MSVNASPQWVKIRVLGEQVKVGDFIGSDQIEVKKLIPQEIRGASHCENPPMLPRGGRCGCHSPAARITQIPRSTAVGPKGQRVILLHHLEYQVTTLR